jgi:hypothetical protein
MVILLGSLKAYTTTYSAALYRKVIIEEFSFSFHRFCGFVLIHTYTWIIKKFSFADDARDAVLIHVPASSEGQERYKNWYSDVDIKALNIHTEGCP